MNIANEIIDVEIAQVNKWYSGGVHAVINMDMEIRKGEFLVFVGPSGCGKTTLLRMIAGLESISGGTISMGGRAINNVAPKNRDIAMVFQNYALYPTMKVGENISFPLKMRRTEKEERLVRVSQVARKLELDALLDRKPGALSGGQRQRVALARAMVRQPKLFLMDEPLSNLDAKLRVSMRREIVSLQRELGVTTVYVTHDQTEAMTMGNRIAVMNGGELQQMGTPREIYNRPKNLFVAGFIGSPPMNLWSGEIRGENGLGFLSFGDALLPLEERLFAPELKRRNLQVGIRPEHLSVTSREDPNAIWLEIADMEHLGRETVVFFKAEGRPTLAMITDGEFEGRPGERIPIRMDGSRLHFFDGETGERLN